MRKILIVSFAVLMLSSCGITTTSTLYYWGGSVNGTTAYENATYKDFKAQSAESTCKLLCIYEDMVSHPGGIRQMPPPGICAEYGYLLLQPDTATKFAEVASDSQKKVMSGIDFTEHGKEMLQKEIEYYPESAKFLEPLIKKLTKQL